MSRKDINFQFLHVQVQLTLNEDSYEWHDPRVSQTFSFSIPSGMFSSKQFAELIEAQLKVLPLQLEAEKARYDAEQKAKEEAEKAKSEVEVEA
jgi:hypothetical protein